MEPIRTANQIFKRIVKQENTDDRTNIKEEFNMEPIRTADQIFK